MSKICKNCTAVNDDKFSYCKNCGTPLDASERSNRYTNYNYDHNYNYNYYNRSNPIPSQIDGVPTEEVGAFVGPNKQKIIDKFSKMSITNSKISWCWPAAILSFFFGFLGAAIWLFYRKMYKYGTIALLIAAIILGINTAITYQPTIDFTEKIFNAFYELKGSSPDFNTFWEMLTQAISSLSATPHMMLSNFINEATTYSATIIYGLFGMYFYKKYTACRITEYRAINKDSEYYTYGINAIGGTSSGMAILAIIIAIALENIISSIPVWAFILF